MPNNLFIGLGLLILVQESINLLFQDYISSRFVAPGAFVLVLISKLRYVDDIHEPESDLTLCRFSSLLEKLLHYDIGKISV